MSEYTFQLTDRANRTVASNTRSKSYIAPDATPEELRAALAEALLRLRCLENARHPLTGMKWVGFDLDGTLARYEGWQGELHIGEPIEKMVHLVKYYLDSGFDVRVCTARLCEDPRGEIRLAIEEWTEKHIGVRLPVTSAKDFDMMLLIDDRAQGVEANTGRIL